MIRYDFPQRMRGVSSARRELTRLERSAFIAFHRKDTRATAYLVARLARAHKAYTALRHRAEQA